MGCCLFAFCAMRGHLFLQRQIKDTEIICIYTDRNPVMGLLLILTLQDVQSSTSTCEDHNIYLNLFPFSILVHPHYLAILPLIYLSLYSSITDTIHSPATPLWGRRDNIFVFSLHPR